MPKLTRNEVRAIVDGEVKFSEKWERERPNYLVPDAQKPIGEWLTYMDVYLEAVKKAVTLANPIAALSNVRCLLNLAETCAMHNGLPRRDDGDKTDIY
ncbi:MAG: hypothetical protein WCF77_04535 [Minisyncoccia bacterium]